MQSPKMETEYTNGVIAVREKYLLKEKLARLCELNAEEAFRMLLDSGYGGGAEVATSVYDYEKLIAVEEEKLDAFILEYAPNEAIAAYLLAPRDFHNAKACVKAAFLGEDATKLLAPKGIILVELIRSCVESGNFKPLGEYIPALQTACEQATALLETEPSGAKVGVIFERALYGYLAEKVRYNRVLRDLLNKKVDMTNILTALRAGEEKIALDKYLPIGYLNSKQLSALFESDSEKVIKSFAGTEYCEFVKLCLQAKEKKQPFTQAEKLLGGIEAAYFARRKYDLQKNQPFLYYAYRRRAENANVRIAFACLLAGLSETEIKARLRAL